MVRKAGIWELGWQGVTEAWKVCVNNEAAEMRMRMRRGRAGAGAESLQVQGSGSIFLSIDAKPFFLPCLPSYGGQSELVLA